MVAGYSVCDASIDVRYADGMQLLENRDWVSRIESLKGNLNHGSYRKARSVPHSRILVSKVNYHVKQAQLQWHPLRRQRRVRIMPGASIEIKVLP